MSRKKISRLETLSLKLGIHLDRIGRHCSNAFNQKCNSSTKVQSTRIV